MGHYNMVVAGTVIATIAWGVASTALVKDRCMPSDAWQHDKQISEGFLRHAQSLFPHLHNHVTDKTIEPF